MTSKEKSAFRQTKAWKTLRDRLKKERKVDTVTLQPLRKGTWNLHHMCLDSEKYKDLDEETLECLNNATHDAVHLIYNAYCKDPESLGRFCNLIKRMYSINHSEE